MRLCGTHTAVKNARFTFLGFGCGVPFLFFGSRAWGGAIVEEERPFWACRDWAADSSDDLERSELLSTEGSS